MTTETPPYTEPRFSPEDVKAMFADGDEPCPRLLVPLHLLLPVLKRTIGPIGKSGEMKPKEGERGPHYAFRRIEDILNEGHGPLCDYGVGWRKVRVVSHELSSNGKAQQCVMVVEYELTGPLGDTMRTTAVGQAVDFGSDKATNKADTAARKNMLVDLLQLATEDPDEERPDRVDERPHVQRAAVAAVDAVKAQITALDDETRAKVKAWCDDHGITVTRAELTVGDHRKLTAYLKAVTPKAADGEAPAATDTPPARPAKAAAKKAPAKRAAAPANGDEPAPPTSAGISDQAWTTFKNELAELTDEQRAAIAQWAETNNHPMTRNTITQKAWTALLKEVRAFKRGSGRAGRQPAKAAQAPAAAPAPPPAEQTPAGVRADILARIKTLGDDVGEQIAGKVSDETGGGGTWEEIITGAPSDPSWTTWLEDTVTAFENDPGEDEATASVGADEEKF